MRSDPVFAKFSLAERGGRRQSRKPIASSDGGILVDDHW
jgi:hypothetical protein